jgi:hypothetical protein
METITDVELAKKPWCKRDFINTDEALGGDEIASKEKNWTRL